MINFIKKLFSDSNIRNSSPKRRDVEELSMILYSQLDFLSPPEFEGLFSDIESILFESHITILSFKNYFTEKIRPLLEKMAITPLMEEIKFITVYKHIDSILSHSNFSDLDKKVLNQQMNKFLMNETLNETIKLRVLEVFIQHIEFNLYNLNQLLTLNHFDLIYFIIQKKLYNDNIEINFNSFLLFNKNIKDLNYATLQIKRSQLGEFLKFLFQKYEGKQSKKDIELLIQNKVFSSGLIDKRNKKESNHYFSLDNIHKKDFLIPVHLLEVFESCQSMKEVIINFFGVYNRRLENLVINAFFKDSHINYDIFAWGLLIQPLKVNIDVVSNHLESKEYPLKLYQIDDISTYDIALLKKFYNDKRILKLISNINKEDMFLLKDTLKLLEIVIKHNIKSDKDQQITKLIKKPKRFKELHDFLSILTIQLNQKNFSLKEQQQSIIPLEKLTNPLLGLSIKVPLMNYDLIEIGQKLGICVGGGHYAEKIQNNVSLIFTVFKNGELSYCIEIEPSSFRIRQAKGIYNKDVPPTDLSWIIKILMQMKEPQGFPHI